MPHLLRVKQEHANKFKGLFPYGPFNRIVYNPSGIYLESGFLDLVLKGFFDFKTYTPAMVQIVKEITPIVGPLTFELKSVDSSCIGLENKCKYLEIKTIRNSCKSEIRESKALNCDEKTDTVTMIDPRGAGKDCTATFTPKVPYPYMPIYSDLNGQSAYNDVIGETNSSDAGSLEGNFLDSDYRLKCIDRDAAEREYKGATKIFCPNDILYKKYCQKQLPPSLYTGKLKLYVQSIYGGNYVEYKNEQGAMISMLFVGPTFEKQDQELAARKAALGRGTHVLYTDSLGNYYLINTTSWTINPLVPTFQGLLLKRYLSTLTALTGLNKDTYEAYILTTCLPTYGVTAVNKPTKLYFGSPLDFGWKANWAGTQLAQVALSFKNDLRLSTLLRINVSSNGIETLHLEEIERKKQNLILQEQRKNPAYTQPPGIFPIYSARVVVNSIESSPGIFDYCFDGDIEDGLWYYAALGSNPSAEDIELAKEKNKQFGGLPYSDQFFTDLPGYFEFELSPEESKSWLEPFQTDKIFVWDSMYQDYNWNLVENEVGVSRPVCPAGEFPLYCWYDRKDVLQVVNYVNRSVNETDNVNVPAEGMCGPGKDYYTIKKYTSGSYAGFEMEGTQFGSAGFGEAFFNKEQGDMTVVGGSWTPEWAGSCGPGPGCDNDGAAPGTPIYGCMGTFWTSWVKVQSGSGDTIVKKELGYTDRRSFLVIPYNDAEGAYFGISSSTESSGSITTTRYDDSLAVAKLESGIVAGWDGKKLSGAETYVAITCGMTAWLSNAWGVSEGRPKQFSCCFCNMMADGRPIETPVRNWGPNGKDTPVTFSNLSPSGTATTVKEETFPSETESFFNSCFVGKDGKKITLSETKIINYFFTLFLVNISVRWPYAQSGNVFSSMQTIQNLKILRSPAGIKMDPKPFPYAKYHYYPIGYV